ncbi:HAD family hydrolase [Limnoglobus roseus]|uniref:HAD family hydrolase n=1 Tax=Limnoglobus roseus TaxID=2598579 RepID=A0A5C1AMC2_9BACT|nr:HAD hydrolase-like protein [Limnoglobus roseus]QEL20391.1 HAD family hydrolase [Limnoglobus roseus]
MALTLEQYATNYLPTRGLPWPIPPTFQPKKARPHLERYPLKAVLWTAYGTLLNTLQGELLFEHPQVFVTENALDKTIKEFNMWNSMSRKPGAPAEYMRELYNKAFTTLKMLGHGSEKHPEVVAEQVWDDIVKKLLQKEYKFDAGLFGALNEYVKKIAYFYHSSIQGCGAYPGAADAIRLLADRGVVSGLLADGQCFTPAQIHKALREEDESFDVNAYIPVNLRILSAEKFAKKPSDTLFKAAVAAVAARGWKPEQVLHVGSNVVRDIAPAKKFGFRTALFAGDKNSLVATGEHLKEPEFRPDILITELPQIAEVMAS